MEPVSILPPSVSELERDLELALARIERVDIPITTLWNPWECPLDALPFLAWALSVDVWRMDWPENIKRRVVANSIGINLIKGTKAAVESAVNSIREGCQLTEWFEQVPEGVPGTFLVDALVTEEGINQQTVSELSRAIDSSKRKSAHYTLRVILSSEGEYGVALAGFSAPISTVEPYTVREIEEVGETLIAFGLLGSNNTIVEALA